MEAAESSVKAAFLYKFPAYVEWPDQSTRESGPVEIGVVGNDAVRAALEVFATDRSPDEQAIRVRHVEDVAEVKGLHVLFIGSKTATKKRAQYVAAAHAKNVLTVTEQASGAQSSIIDFLIESGRVRFTISLPAAQSANLKISSRLLAVASEVRKGASE
jgi:hypothetical protein